MCGFQKKKKSHPLPVSFQRNHPMKPFRNRGWRWLQYMEKILPIAAATGARSYAATEANPPLLVDQPEDQDSDHAISHNLSHNSESDEMDVDKIIKSAAATSSSTSVDISHTADDILHPPATKRQRLGTMVVPHSPRSPSRLSRAESQRRGRGRPRLLLALPLLTLHPSRLIQPLNVSIRSHLLLHLSNFTAASTA